MRTSISSKADNLPASREVVCFLCEKRDFCLYIDWYYAKFLYHHKEMFLDFLEFAEANKESDSEKVTEEIREYFTLPFIEIKSDEMYYSKLSLKEIADKVAQGIGRNTLTNVERINSNRYMYNLDCFLFLGNLKLYARFDKSRFERIIRNTSAKQNQELMDAINKVFAKLNATGRFEIIRCLRETGALFGGDEISICDALYKNADKDKVYYADRAIYENRTTNKKRIRKNTGYSMPGLFKGTRVHVGGSNSEYVDDVKYSTIKGVLYITTKRIIFVGGADGFDRKIEDLVAVTPYANCIEFQFSKDTLDAPFLCLPRIHF